MPNQQHPRAAHRSEPPLVLLGPGGSYRHPADVDEGWDLLRFAAVAVVVCILAMAAIFGVRSCQKAGTTPTTVTSNR